MNISPVLFVSIVLICLAIGGAVGLYVGRLSGANNSREVATLHAHAAAASARAERLEEENNALIDRARSDQDVMRALAPLAQQLDVMTRRVQGLQDIQVAQRAELHEQMESVGRTQQELARETSALRSALTSTSARGTWGEVELRRIVEAAGMVAHVDFSEQLSTAQLSVSGSASRPDLTIHLPGGSHIAVDAKVPLDAILRAQEISGHDYASETLRSELLAEHAKAVRGHISALAKRNYPADFPGSPQITVMFLPTESLLSEAISTDAALLEDALRMGVTPTSPSSLLALLRAIATVWASTQVTQEAQAIVSLGRTLFERLNVVAGHLDSLGNSLRSSVKNYNKAIGSLESRVLVTAREFASVEVTPRDLHAISADDAQVRQVVAPELLESGSAATLPSAHAPYGGDPDERR